MRSKYGVLNTLIVVLVLLGFTSGCMDSNSSDNTIESYDESRTFTREGYLEEENTQNVFSYNFNENASLTDFRVTLTWMDEPDLQRGLRTYRNSEELFQVWIISGSVTQTADGFNAHGEQGQITVEYPFHYQNDAPLKGPFTIEVAVELVSSGDYHYYMLLDPFTISDPGNDFNCDISLSYVSSEGKLDFD